MMTHDEVYSRWFQLVDAQLDGVEKNAALPEPFHLITRGGDRHGALERTYYSRDTEGDGMDRLVSIAALPVPQGAGTFEFWFGGRSADRFVRRLASSLQVLLDDPDWGDIADALADAIDQARAVTESDLSEILRSALF